MQDNYRIWLIASAFGGILWFMRWAAGRLAPQAALKPLLFLITRKPVMIVWALGALGWFTFFWRAGLAHGHDPSQDLALLTFVSVLCGGGIAALGVGMVFMIVRAFARAPELPLEPGESLLRQVRANHFLGGEARGGTLLITDRRLAFRPHRFNIQLDCWSLPRAEIGSFETSGERLLVVKPRTGAPEWLVVMDPDALAQSLLQQPAQ